MLFYFACFSVLALWVLSECCFALWFRPPPMVRPESRKNSEKSKISGVFVAVSMPYFSAAGVPPLNDFPDKSLFAQGLARGGEGPPPVPSATLSAVSADLHTAIFSKGLLMVCHPSCGGVDE